MTALDYLDIQLIQASREKVVLKMIVDEKHLQPFKLMHGGINALLIETATSIGANESLDTTQQVAVGVDMQVNHLKSAIKGEALTVIATPDHIGKSLHVWQAEVINQTQQKISVGRCTLMVKKID